MKCPFPQHAAHHWFGWKWIRGSLGSRSPDLNLVPTKYSYLYKDEAYKSSNESDVQHRLHHPTASRYLGGVGVDGQVLHLLLWRNEDIVGLFMKWRGKT